ncbi:hypothetical protein H2203_001948 [Taxawa tesnikishii (nom. ined.)]|nr:hypothetical protein H2203_001948 [Dothideales sp. JES 119]
MATTTRQDVARTLEEGDRGSSPLKQPAKPKQGSLFSRERALGPVTNDYGDLALLACSFVTGMVDAASFSNWAVFCGMQTGNTVILGLSTATVPSNPHAWTTTLVSIASYLLGAFLTFRLTFWFIPKGAMSNRLWLSMLVLVQGLLCLLAAGLVTPAHLVPHNPPGVDTAATATSIIHNIRISGMQIAVSRLLGFNELPVNVLTSTYCDLMGDPKLLAVQNVKRNRRFASVVLLLAGAISSGWLMRSSGGLCSVFYISGGIKTITGILVFVFFKRKEETTKA